MRNKIFGGVGILWGGFILVNWLLFGTSSAPGHTNAAYRTGYTMGQWGAHIFGVALLIAGLYYFFKKPKSAT